MDGTYNAFGDNNNGELLFGDYIFVHKQDTKVSVKSFAVLDDTMEDGTHASDHNPIQSILYLND